MPLTLEDRFAIMELTARYHDHLSRYEAEQWADLFTEDGLCEAGNVRRMSGRAELVAYVKRTEEAKRRRRNFASIPVVEGNGDQATLRATVVSLTLEGGINIAVLGEYDDKLVKVNGEWKFKHRKITLYEQPGYLP